MENICHLLKAKHSNPFFQAFESRSAVTPLCNSTVTQYHQPDFLIPPAPTLPGL